VEADLAAFCRKEHPRLLGALYLYCGDHGLAEDLAQEALARACERWTTVSVMEAPGAWVHRVALNLAKSQLRRGQAERRANRRSLAGTRDLVEHHDAERIAVLRALATLKPKQRQVLVLHHYLGYSLGEIGELLGMSLNTVKSHSSRGVHALEQVLGEGSHA
jgi:RNA polymerase sigma-70 factor (ECF subfamily)